MTFDTKDLARQGAYEALKLRTDLEKPLSEPICIYDLVEDLGMELHFMSAASMEGMYTPRKPKSVIVLSSLRPHGRQRFTCAHELGHHIFGHGSKIDELKKNEKRFSPNEFIADCFAGFLIAPKVAVHRAFSDRGWEISKPSPEQIFTLSCYFGMGYTSLITHMERSLNLISAKTSEELKGIKLPHLRIELLGFLPEKELLVADSLWNSRPIDLQVGDLLLAPKGTVVEGEHATVQSQNGIGTIICATL